MAFRHFLRHAYAIHLEPRRLADRATEVIRAAPLAIRDLRAFSEFLGQVVESYYGQ
jgi:hypothetical protein